MRMLFCFLLLVCGVSSEVPVQHSLNRYSSLWRSSPFTVKPTTQVTQRPNELNNYVLLGVASNSEGGHTVTMVDKRDRTKRKRIHSSGQYNESGSQGYRILEVARKGLDYKETRVRIAYGENTAWISYDPKILAVKPPPQVQSPARPAQIQKPSSVSAPSKPGLPPGLDLNNKEESKEKVPTTRRPRIRRIVQPKQ